MSEKLFYKKGNLGIYFLVELKCNRYFPAFSIKNAFYFLIFGKIFPMTQGGGARARWHWTLSALGLAVTVDMSSCHDS